MPAADSLGALGISQVEESVYRLLLRQPGVSSAEITQLLGAEHQVIHTALYGLERHGLVSLGPGPEPLYVPVAPDVGMEALILRRQADLEQARTLANRLMSDFHEGRRAQPPGVVEIVSGAEAVHRRFEQLQRGAKRLVQVLDTPPYARMGGTPNKVEGEVLARGVEYRGIYDKAALEAAPGTMNAIARYVAAGEQARFLSKLPLKLATFDREFGYVPLTVSQPDIAMFMVVRPCSLLDALLYIFDTLWERATPITFGPDGPGRDHDKAIPASDDRLLNLLATGMTDEAIAHHLGLSYRTARRRIAALMTDLGAESRFQAGVQASRTGRLLSPAIPSVSRSAQAQQPLRVQPRHLGLVRRRERQRVEHRPAGGVRGERVVHAEQHPVHSEHGDRAQHRRQGEHGARRHPHVPQEVGGRRLGEPAHRWRQHVVDAAQHDREHLPAVPADHPQPRVAVEDAARDEPQRVQPRLRMPAPGGGREHARHRDPPDVPRCRELEERVTGLAPDRLRDVHLVPRCLRREACELAQRREP